MISLGFIIYLFIYFFDIFISEAVRGAKGQKMAQDDKKICCSWYLRNNLSYDCHLWYTCVKWWYLPGLFFHFFKTLILWVVKEGGGVKGQKMVQNENKFCLSRSISQESYIIWFWFKVLMCKMIISPGIFFIFWKFWFSG